MAVGYLRKRMTRPDVRQSHRLLRRSATIGLLVQKVFRWRSVEPALKNQDWLLAAVLMSRFPVWQARSGAEQTVVLMGGFPAHSIHRKVEA